MLEKQAFIAVLHIFPNFTTAFQWFNIDHNNLNHLLEVVCEAVLLFGSSTNTVVYHECWQ